MHIRHGSTLSAEAVRFAPGAPGVWERCVDAARSDGKSRLAALLGRARATWNGDERLVLSFPELTRLNRDLIARDTTKKYLSDLLSANAGSPVAVEVRFDEGAAGSAPAEPDETPPTAPNADAATDLPALGKKVQDLFRARPLDDAAGGAGA